MLVNGHSNITNDKNSFIKKYLNITQYKKNHLSVNFSKVSGLKICYIVKLIFVSKCMFLYVPVLELACSIYIRMYGSIINDDTC